MAQARRLEINPADPTQMMVLWSNGTITTIGGAPSPSGNPTWNADPVGSPAVAFRVTDWDTPSGYTMDWYGIVHAWGGAPAVVGQINDGFGFNKDNADLRIAVDFHVNITGGGAANGHVLDVNGNLWEFGTAATIVTGLNLPGLARRLINDYGSGHKWILDGHGGLHSVSGAPAASGPGYWANGDFARAYDLVDWASGKGWVMDLVGGLHQVNGADTIPGGPYWSSGGDIARDFKVLSQDPDRYAILDYQGNVHQWTVNEAPTCGAFGPPSPVTNTTRPTVGFLFYDPNGDSLQEAQLALFKQSDLNNLSNEMQRIQLTGATSGSVKFDLEGNKVTWAWNASAATVQTAIRTLPGMDTSLVTGSAGNWVIEYRGTRGKSRQPYARIINLLNAGASIAYTRDQRGTDPFGDAVAAYRLWETTVTNPLQSLVTLDFDIADDDYRLYAKATDSAGAESGVTNAEFTVAVIRPDAPSLQAIDRGGLSGIAIVVDASGAPDGSLVSVDFSDDNQHWMPLRGSATDITITTGPGDPEDPVVTKLRGDLMGWNAWPSSENLGHATDLGTRFMRFSEERQWYANDDAFISEMAVQIAAAKAEGKDVITGMLGVTAAMNPHSETAYPASVGSQTGNLLTAIPDAANPPAGVYINNATGNWPLFGRIRLASGAVIGYDSCIQAGSSVALQGLWHDSGSSTGATVGAAITTYYPAVRSTGHWFPSTDSARNAYADLAVRLAKLLDPAKDYFELWNEPNIEDFNAGLYQDPAGPYYQSEAEYGKMCVAIIKKVRAACPNLKIIMGSVASWGDINSPNPANSLNSMKNYTLRTILYTPELKTTARPDFWGIHPYNWGGGVTAGYDEPSATDDLILARTPNVAYRTSSAKTNKGWNGHVQALEMWNMLRSSGFPTDQAQLMVTEVGCPGVSPAEDPTSGDSLASMYPEDWQATHFMDDIDVSFARVDLGIYAAPVILHTLPVMDDSPPDSIYHYYGVYNESGGFRPAAFAVGARAREVISSTGGGGGGGGTVTGRGLIDTEAHFGKPRYYRSQVYTVDPWLASDPSNVVSAILSGQMWALSNPTNAWLQMKVSVIPDFEFEQAVSSYVSPVPAGADAPVVIRDGALKGGNWSFKIRTLNEADYNSVLNILNSGDELLLRDPFGRAWYFKIDEGVKIKTIKAKKLASEPFPIRHAHEFDISVQTVVRSQAHSDIPALDFV